MGCAPFVEIFSKGVMLDSVRGLQPFQSLGSCGGGHRCDGFEGASTWTSLKTDLQGAQPRIMCADVV